MITRIVRLMLRRPRLRRFFWRRWYQFLARRQPQHDWVFMNYGYVILNGGETPPRLDGEHEAQRNWIQLYHHVASGADLSGKRLLEVGSGRGGGAAYVHRYLGPAETVGIDLAPAAVAFSNRVHGGDGLSYRQGDAENLPLAEASFDVVLNVESSHCYGSMPRFLSEVRRVLRPGGYFCYADLRRKEDLAGLQADLAGNGLRLVREENIAPNVLAALKQDNLLKREYIRAHAPRWLWDPLNTFAGIEGSAIWRGLEEGTTIYHCAVLQKPA